MADEAGMVVMSGSEMMRQFDAHVVKMEVWQ